MADRAGEREVCPNCDGHGDGWHENPIICGGLPCVECNGVCVVCLGSDDPSTWDLRASRAAPAPAPAGLTPPPPPPARQRGWAGGFP